MQVHFFFRKPNGIFFSIEELFTAIQKQLKNKICIADFTMPFESKGITKRFKNILFAWRFRGKINHITGDDNYLGLFLPRKSTILTIHDCGELDKHKGLKKFFLWLFWFYLPVKRLRYITVISETTKRRLLKYVKTNPEKIIVIPNCLIGNFLPRLRPFNKIKPVILHIGITPNKNIERLAAALENISCKLKIIGKPTEEQKETLNSFNIEFEYKENLTREEIIQEYDNCDIVAFVSLLEGFGLPIIEGQAMLKPVITSNISAMPETAGLGACFVDPYNITDIRNAFLKIINDDEYRMDIVKLGIINTNRFKPELVADKYLELYTYVNLN